MTDQQQPQQQSQVATDRPKIGLFLACYQIGEAIPGGVLFHVQFAVSTPNETVNGSGQITQAINPPLDIHTTLAGSYSYMTVMPDQTHILVTATGTVIVQLAPPAIGQVTVTNAQLHMVLESNWQSGIANYKYLDNANMWQSVSNAPVKLVPSESLT